MWSCSGSSTARVPSYQPRGLRAITAFLPTVSLRVIQGWGGLMLPASPL